MISKTCPHYKSAVIAALLSNKSTSYLDNELSKNKSIKNLIKCDEENCAHWKFCREGD